MISMRKLLFVLVGLLFSVNVMAQVQTVYGTVTDAESKKPLVGVIVVNLGNTQLNGFSDENGHYSIANVPVGRQSFRFSYVGYKTAYANEVMLTSDKQFQLNIALEEEAQSLDEVQISAAKDRSKAQNDFASISSLSFSVEEAKRYAASVADPTRMAMNFAGVSNNGDLENQVVVRFWIITMMLVLVGLSTLKLR